MRLLPATALLCTTLSVAACSHAATSSSPHERSHNRASVEAPLSGKAPAATPSPAPTQSPEQTPPHALPSAAVKHVMRLPPDAAPRILAVAMSETTVHRGDRVSGSVVTSSNVASVQARVGGYAMPLTKVGVGRFAITYTVNVPWFVRGDFTMHVIANNSRGEIATNDIRITVR